jgi:hypothetical protein
VPSLDLRLADNKSLTDAVTGASLVTFTRASSKTVTNSAGVLETVGIDVPAFDHNPTTGESLGLLVEEQRTNLCLQSAAISTSPWAANGIETCVASTLTDPAGGLNAFKINFSGAGAFERWQQPITVVNGTAYTLSAWVRSTSGTTSFRIRFGAGVTSSDLTATTTWQRFNFTLTASTTAGFFAFNSPSTGIATEIHAWGAQLEAGAFPTSYIPTTTAAVTRSADVASITGSALSSWYRQDEGTVFADISPSQFNGRIYMFDDSTTNERWETRIAAPNSPVFTSWSANVIDVSLNDFVNYGIPTSRLRIASVNKSNSAAHCINGGSVLTDSSSTMPANQSRLFIGSFQGTATYLNGPIRRLAFWPQALPFQLQSLTQ